MAIDSYMAFQTYDGKWLDAESQVDFSQNKEPLMKQPTELKSGYVFEIEDFSFDVEQTLSIGSQSKGAGAGKITFNPFSITRKIDKQSPIMYGMACSGTPFQTVALALRKSSGGAVAGLVYLRFDFKLVAVKTISWSYDDEAPKEEITFEYGGLQVRYSIQDPNGNMEAPIATGWNRVKNVADTSSTPIS